MPLIYISYNPHHGNVLSLKIALLRSMTLWCSINIIYHLYDGDILHDNTPRSNINDTCSSIIFKAGIITRRVINQCSEQVLLVESLAIDQVPSLHNNDTVYQNSPVVIEQLAYAD